MLTMVLSLELISGKQILEMVVNRHLNLQQRLLGVIHLQRILVVLGVRMMIPQNRRAFGPVRHRRSNGLLDPHNILNSGFPKRTIGMPGENPTGLPTRDSTLTVLPILVSNRRILVTISAEAYPVD